jgi:YegS C-terminal NAD kinase beta sandwich-like domain
MTLRKGVSWGRPASAPADLVVTGDDADLAEAVAEHLGSRVSYRAAPGSDFARAIGLADASDATTELPCDALEVAADGTAHTAVNMVVFGTAPDRQRWWSRARRVLVRVDGRVVHDGDALGVVIANGQHLRGYDVVPRGHPGDGRAEVHVYALERGERRAMRSRLRDGTHVPHPRIVTATGRQIDVWAAEGIRRLEIDGHPRSPVTGLTVTVRPEAFLLLV